MKHGVRAAKYIAISGMLAAGGMGACSSDDSSLQGGNNNDAGITTPDSGSSGGDSGTVITPGDDDSGSADAGTGTQTDSNAPPTTDSGTDSAVAIDAADSAVTPFCQTQSGLSFCQDFDEATSLSLDGGDNSTWTQILSNVTDAGTEVVLSTAQAKSPPQSLYVTLPLGSVAIDQSAKVVKQINPAAGVTQAIYEFDIFIDKIPAVSNGGFATDFQFVDGDQFGFRIGVFGNADGTFNHADLEHNHQILAGSGGDDITPTIPLTAHAWNHVKMSVAFSAVANDGGDDVDFKLYLNNSATAAVDATYPAPFAKAAYARFAAGMVYAFDGQIKNWGIYYDNFTLKLQ